MSSKAAASLIRIEHLRFRYGQREFELNIPELEVAAGERLACTGPSGSGKTTLIQLISGVLVPQAGRVFFDERELSNVSDRERRELRIGKIGMVFQEFELLEYLSALDNILLPYHLGSGLRLDKAARERARVLARELEIDDLLEFSPANISQGERQRVALCRALVTQPKLLLCDEATGNLDPGATQNSLQLLFDAVERQGATLFLVTHEQSLLPAFERVLKMDELSPSQPAANAGERGPA